MGLREEKRSSTRAAIEQSAWSLAVHRPWADITIDEIAAAAGVARRTFFNYFDSKEQLLRAIGSLQPDRFLTVVRDRPDEEDLWESLTVAQLDQVRSSSRESIERMRALWREPSALAQNIAGRGRLERTLVEEICRRRPALDRGDALLITAVFLTATRAAIQAWVDEGEREEPVDAVARALRAVRVSEQLTAAV